MIGLECTTWKSLVPTNVCEVWLIIMIFNLYNHSQISFSSLVLKVWLSIGLLSSEGFIIPYSYRQTPLMADLITTRSPIIQNNRKTGKVYTLEHTKIWKALFTVHHGYWDCMEIKEVTKETMELDNNGIWGKHWNNVIQGTSCNNVTQQWPWFTVTTMSPTMAPVQP